MSTEILADGLCFGEGPRWRDGELWLSDMHAHEVLRIGLDGTRTTVAEVTNRPSGLGWLPNGDLLIVSMVDRSILRHNGSELRPHADLSALASFHCNDMVVDAVTGRAYVGNFRFRPARRQKATVTAELICVEPDGSRAGRRRGSGVSQWHRDHPGRQHLDRGVRPWGGRLTAFDIEANAET